MIMRNTEVHRAFMIQCIVAVIATLLTALLDIKYGLITLLVCILFILIYIVSVKKRYKLISE
ncbi:MAG: hypothetical protein K2K66_04540, partial [Ruminococcus sp.]|nr:hypothetical protein [Ruminococcus sp.]